METIEKDDFVHLHVHSEYSTLDGINRVDTLPTYVKNLGMTSCATTEHGTLAGSLHFVNSCRKAGIKPIQGIEAYFCGDRFLKAKDEFEESYYHLILLALNNKGLHNLMRLSTLSYTEGMYRKPRCDNALLEQYSSDLFATSACLGSKCAQLIMKGHLKEAEKTLVHHAEIFKDRFAIEVQTHRGEQRMVNEVMIGFARKYNLPIVVTGDCHYTEKEDKALHEITLAIQTNQQLSDPKRFTFGDIEVYVADANDMAHQCIDANIPLEALKNTKHISDMVTDDYFSDMFNHFPTFKSCSDLPSWEVLENLSKNKLMDKFEGKIPRVYKERLEEELRTIKQLGFYDYMLIVSEIINETRKQGVFWGPGRGSGAGSLIAFALGITQVDPIKYGLLFERFLSLGRAAQPIIFTPETRKAALEQLCHKH